MQIIDNDTILQSAVDALVQEHPIFARVLEETGAYPPLRSGTGGFTGLAEIVVSQQISKAAANSILARLWQAVQDSATPEQGYLRLSAEQKRACGLSRPKVRYLDGIAEACIEGKIAPEVLEQQDDATLIKTLTALPGLGLWSAEIYALFILGRPDVMPAADLALQESARKLHDLPKRPDTKAFRQLSDQWRPHRSAAARLLWHYYRGAAVGKV